MGAWGLALFNSDHELDLISDLSHEAGLQEAVKAKRSKMDKKKRKKKKAMRVEATDGKDGEETKSEAKPLDQDAFSSDRDCWEDPHHPEDPELVRRHMDSGVLAKMLNKYENEFYTNKSKMFMEFPGLPFTLLIACGMQLGCQIPLRYIITMQK